MSCSFKRLHCATLKFGKIPLFIATKNFPSIGEIDLFNLRVHCLFATFLFFLFY